jgi:hypothetical protein
MVNMFKLFSYFFFIELKQILGYPSVIEQKLLGAKIDESPLAGVGIARRVNRTDVEPDFIDLLSKILRCVPVDRISAFDVSQ